MTENELKTVLDEHIKPIRLTKYQKWLCQPGNDRAFHDYVYKRLRHQLRREIDKLYSRPAGIFNGYFTGIFNQRV